MQLTATFPVVAHVPAVNGYDPVIPGYGDAHIVSGPGPLTGAYETFDGALAAAHEMTDMLDTATGVFQASKGIYQLGSLLHSSSSVFDDVDELSFDQKIADQVVFDDPALQAIVTYDAVAKR